MRTIQHNGVLLAILGNAKDIPVGRFFWPDESSPIQWGTQYLGKGDATAPHVHKIRNRQFKSKTIEVFVVLSGKLRANIYTPDKTRIESIILRPGCFLVTYDGGHGFEAVNDETKFIEVKLGPFVGVEDDKDRF